MGQLVRLWEPGEGARVGARGPMTIRLVLADDHPMMRDGLRLPGVGIVAFSPDSGIGGRTRIMERLDLHGVAALTRYANATRRGMVY